MTLVLFAVATACCARSGLLVFGPDGAILAPDARAACVDRCWSQGVAWTVEGGLAGCRLSGHTTSCNDVSVTVSRGGETAICTALLPACPPDGGTHRFSTFEVEQALAHRDMVAAFAAAPVRYGQAVPDGMTFTITVGSRTVTVDEDCTGGSCRPVPAGVAAVRTLLSSVLREQATNGACPGLARVTYCF